MWAYLIGTLIVLGAVLFFWLRPDLACTSRETINVSVVSSNVERSSTPHEASEP